MVTALNPLDKNPYSENSLPVPNQSSLAFPPDSQETEGRQGARWLLFE